MSSRLGRLDYPVKARRLSDAIYAGPLQTVLAFEQEEDGDPCAYDRDAMDLGVTLEVSMVLAQAVDLELDVGDAADHTGNGRAGLRAAAIRVTRARQALQAALTVFAELADAGERRAALTVAKCSLREACRELHPPAHSHGGLGSALSAVVSPGVRVDVEAAESLDWTIETAFVALVRDLVATSADHGEVTHVVVADDDGAAMLRVMMKRRGEAREELDELIGVLSAVNGLQAQTTRAGYAWVLDAVRRQGWA